jgi:hypothetical protein
MWGRELIIDFRIIGEIFYFRVSQSPFENIEEINLLWP